MNGDFKPNDEIINILDDKEALKRIVTASRISIPRGNLSKPANVLPQISSPITSPINSGASSPAPVIIKQSYKYLYSIEYKSR
jgi:hypothetical protein